MVKIRSRGSWGARYPNGDRTLTGLATAVFLHHTVTTHLPASATVAQEQAQMRVIESIGFSRFGRYGIGISYNVIIFPSGRAYQGVSFNRRGAHTDGRNSVVRSICFAGNYESNRPTRAALKTAADIVAQGRGKWWVKSARVFGHRDIKATSCPGRYVYAQKTHIAAAGSLTGGSGLSAPKPAPTPKPSPKKRLRVDGVLGWESIGKLQTRLKEAGFYKGAIDGRIDSQNPRWRAANTALAGGWQWQANYKGSATIRGLQEFLRSKGYYKGRVDGLIGPNTLSALQRFLKKEAKYRGKVDGEFWRRGGSAKALQKVLNSKRGFKR